MTDRERLLRLKTERADQHIRDMEKRMQRLWAENTPIVTPEDKTEPGYVNCRVRGIPIIPNEWGPLIGDALHNLRSALDHLIGHLVESEGNPITADTQFPIKKNAKTFEASLKAEVKGVSGDAIKILRPLKPYKGGNDPLWRLHRLNIADKHKMLIPVVAIYKSLGFDAVAQMRAIFPDDTWDDFPPLRYALRLAGDRSVKDGDSLYKIPLADWPESDQNPQFTFEIAFGQVEPVKGEPVLATLDELLRLTNETIDLFVPLLRD